MHECACACVCACVHACVCFSLSLYLFLGWNKIGYGGKHQSGQIFFSFFSFSYLCDLHGRIIDSLTQHFLQHVLTDMGRQVVNAEPGGGHKYVDVLQLLPLHLLNLEDNNIPRNFITSLGWWLCSVVLWLTHDTNLVWTRCEIRCALSKNHKKMTDLLECFCFSSYGMLSISLQSLWQQFNWMALSNKIWPIKLISNPKFLFRGPFSCSKPQQNQNHVWLESGRETTLWHGLVTVWICCGKWNKIWHYNHRHDHTIIMPIIKNTITALITCTDPNQKREVQGI